MNSYAEQVLNSLNNRYPWEKEFLQSDVLTSVYLGGKKE